MGIPDESWGEAVTAFIVLKPGHEMTRAAIADWVGAHIAGYKKPRYVEFVAALPRNVSGKILKTELAGYTAGTGPEPESPCIDLQRISASPWPACAG